MQKFASYFENVKLFADREIVNGNKLIDLYDKILGLNTQLITLNDT